MADAGRRVKGHPPEGWHQPKVTGASSLSLPVEEGEDHPDQLGVSDGRQLPTHGLGLILPRGHHGLAQAVRRGLTAVQHAGGRLLRLAPEATLVRGKPEVFNTDQSLPLRRQREASSPAWSSPRPSRSMR